MTPKVKKLFSQAMADKEFQAELKVHEPKHYKVGLFWTLTDKLTYASIYMGWLIAKGTYDENNFKP